MKQTAVLTEYEIKSKKINKPLKIGLISDLHERKADDIFELLKIAAPDMIAIAGDTLERFGEEHYERVNELNPIKSIFFIIAMYVDHAVRVITRNKNTAEPENAYRFLKASGKLAPSFMSLGNHEEELTENDRSILSEYGVTLLDNSSVKAEINGQELLIGGLSSFYDEEWLKGFSEEKGFKILLCHHPEYYDRFVKETDTDLVLSGHNHGGQFRLFGKGLISSSSGLFPKYDRGIFENRLVISAGCSNTAAVPRLCNPREVVIIKLSPE